MLRFLRPADLAAFPRLADSMFRDRTAQFRDRHGWPVQVDARGWEQDEYDAMDPLYVIWEGRDGLHRGSLRFLPTTGRIMANDHFAALLPAGPIRDPAIWECTRFCLGATADRRVAAGLMLAGGDLMRREGLAALLGIFDAPMLRVYRGIGSEPKVLGRSPDGICIGLWDQTASSRQRVRQRAGLSFAVAQQWMVRSLGPMRA